MKQFCYEIILSVFALLVVRTYGEEATTNPASYPCEYDYCVQWCFYDHTPPPAMNVHSVKCQYDVCICEHVIGCDKESCLRRCKHTKGSKLISSRCKRGVCECVEECDHASCAAQCDTVNAFCDAQSSTKVTCGCADPCDANRCKTSCEFRGFDNGSCIPKTIDGKSVSYCECSKPTIRSRGRRSKPIFIRRLPRFLAPDFDY